MIRFDWMDFAGRQACMVVLGVMWGLLVLMAMRSSGTTIRERLKLWLMVAAFFAFMVVTQHVFVVPEIAYVHYRW